MNENESIRREINVAIKETKDAILSLFTTSRDSNITIGLARIEVLKFFAVSLEKHFYQGVKAKDFPALHEFQDSVYVSLNRDIQLLSLTKDALKEIKNDRSKAI